MNAKLLAYLTNHLIAHLPSHRVRLFWYRRVLGAAIGNRCSILMGAFVYFYGRFNKGADALELGDHTVINRRCTLDVRGGIHCGRNVSISPEVMILTSEHLKDDPDFGVRDRPVRIHDYAWVGTRATVLPGVTLGEGAIVAAGSVVSRDVEPYTVVGGVPAKPIGKRGRELRYNLEFRPLFE